MEGQMDANQLIKALGDAAGAAKPPQEYCLLWVDTWATCMTKAEWSGWMQAIGAVLAVAFAGAIAAKQIKAARIDAENDRHEARRLAANLRQLDDLKRSEMLMAILSVALQASRSMQTKLDGGEFHKTPHSLLAHLTECADQIVSLPLFDIPGRDVAIGVAVLPRQLRTTAEFGLALKAGLTKTTVPEGLPEAFSTSLATLLQELHDLLTLLGMQVGRFKQLTGVQD